MSLRERALKSGAYLVIRQGLGMVMGLGGTMLLIHVIGPGDYGLYASALGIVGYIGSLAGLGVNVYIVRQEAAPSIQIYSLAFTFMFVTGTTGALLGYAAVPLLQWWLQNPAFIPPLLALLPALPLTALALPAFARLERDLNYRPIAMIELTGQLVYNLFAITLAYCGKGVWAPVIAYLLSQAIVLAGACVSARLCPRPYWAFPLLREMTGYGAGYSTSLWVWQLRTLVNPLIVGRYAGPDGVGYVAMAVRVVDALSFVKGASWRVSIAMLAKLQGDFPRLKRAMEEVQAIQVVFLGPILAGFAWLASLLLPALFGEKWNPVLLLYPFIALSYLSNAVFSMHAAVLYVLARNWDVTAFHVTHILLFGGGALFLVPRFGLSGYGYAEVLALLGYFVIHQRLGRFFHPSFAEAVPWLVSFLPPLFIPLCTFPSGLALWLPLLFVLWMPGPRKKIGEYIKWIQRGFI